MLVLVNDTFLQREDVKIDFEDRGYQFGDGIYEVIRIYDNKPFLLQEHLQRLQRSASEIKLALPYPLNQISDNVNKLIAYERPGDGIVYLQITRGIARRDHHFPHPTNPQLIAYVSQVTRPHTSITNGIHAITVEDIRWLRCDIKSLNLLPNVLAKQTAYEQNVQEAIFCRSEIVTEGSSTNFFIVDNDTLITHPSNHLILNGITRTVVLNMAQQLGIPVRETEFSRSAIFTADEAFVTGTTSEISPVITVDGKRIGKGRPGDITKTLQAHYEKLIQTL